MFSTFRNTAIAAATLALAALAFTLPAAARAAQVPANADAFQTLPGAASVTINGSPVPLEGAEFSASGTDPFYPLTAAEVTRLNTLAPNLGLVQDQLQWFDPHHVVVGGTASHQYDQVLTPVLSTTPNFDTVVQRLDTLTFTAAGQVQETQIRVLMLNLQSVAPVLIGGFDYELLVVLANGSPVFDPTDTADPQFLGNLKFDSTAVDANGVTGTLDLGVTGPTPTAANLGADLPSGMEALPYNTDISFIPLDGGPAIPVAKGEVIVQNTGPSSFRTVPEPASAALLGVGLLGLAGLRRRRLG